MRSQSSAIPTATAHLYTDGATGALKERRFRFSVIKGPDRGIQTLLDSGTTIVGTHPNCQIRLQDPTVSRYHLELQMRADGLKVSDLGSTNGTVHAGTKLGAVILAGPARLRLGKSTEAELLPADEALAIQPFAGDRFGDVIGASTAMRSLFALLARVAASEATVLLEGETGTGKEALAEAIHRASPRSDGAFVVVDCGTIARDLVASELFGHVRGAFTGALGEKEGLIEAAHGGTLFLDEVGELAVDLQPQLLRALEKHEVRRIGEVRARKVDLRVIAATHRDLRQKIAEGSFREDLFFRLAVVRAVVPPLRDRREDVALLAHHFATELGRGGFALPDPLVRELQAYDWPGNVRELRNLVEQALSLGDSGLPIVPVGPVGPDPPRTQGALAVYGTPPPAMDLPFKEAKGQLVDAFECQYLTHLLAKYRGNISRAAVEAGIDRNYIHRLVKKHNIPVPRGPEGD